MAAGCRERLGTRLRRWPSAASPGPDGGTPDKPVGTTWIALATPAAVYARRYRFPADRRRNRLLTVAAAVDALRRGPRRATTGLRPGGDDDTWCRPDEGASWPSPAGEQLVAAALASRLDASRRARGRCAGPGPEHLAPDPAVPGRLARGAAAGPAGGPAQACRAGRPSSCGRPDWGPFPTCSGRGSCSCTWPDDGQAAALAAPGAGRSCAGSGRTGPRTPGRSGRHLTLARVREPLGRGRDQDVAGYRLGRFAGDAGGGFQPAWPATCGRRAPSTGSWLAAGCEKKANKTCCTPAPGAVLSCRRTEDRIHAGAEPGHEVSGGPSGT